MTQIRPLGLDHIVLNVADIDASLAFYCGKLALTPVRVDEWRAKQVRFPSVRVNPETIIDLVQAPPTGSNLDHFCLVIEPLDFDVLLAEHTFDVETGPVWRSGAQGDGLSVYLRDPDGNLVELRYYP